MGKTTKVTSSMKKNSVLTGTKDKSGVSKKKTGKRLVHSPSSPPQSPTNNKSNPITLWDSDQEESGQPLSVPTQDTSSLFRLQAKNLFLTWPKNTCTKEALLTRIQEDFDQNLDWAIVAEEVHKDGSPHLHAVIALHKKTYFKGNAGIKRLDSLTGKHGNYQAARKLGNTVQYVTKDGVYVSANVDVPEYLNSVTNKQSTKSDRMIKMLQDGKTFDDLVAEEPGFTMMNKRKLEEAEAYFVVKRMKASLKEWPKEGLDLEAFTGNAEDITIAHWLNENMLTTRILKAAQLYITGGVNLGKTTFLMNLAKYFRIYYIPFNEDFWCDYNDNDYDLAVLDEFKGQKQVTSPSLLAHLTSSRYKT